MATGSGTKDDPWVLKTPPGTSEYTMYRDEASDPPTIVCQVGGTKLLYDARAIDDLHAMLKAHGDWMPLGGADEQKPAPEARSRPGAAPTANPRRRLVRPQEGPARPVRRVHAAADGGARAGRGDPRRQEQPDAGRSADRATSSSARATAERGRAHPPAIRSTRSATRIAGRSWSCWAPVSARSRRSPTSLPISRPAVSRHLRLLKRAGLVVETPRGTRRIYQLHDQGMEAVRGVPRAGLGRGRRPVPAASPANTAERRATDR